MTEIEYHYDSYCEHCDHVKLTEHGEDFTLRVEAKEEYGEDAPTDHDCEFTRHEKLEEPIVREFPTP